jgi:hypothetical protein
MKKERLRGRLSGLEMRKKFGKAKCTDHSRNFALA